MKKIAIILPAYNEELTIAGTISDFHEAIPHAEIWVINNNSTDSTELISKKVIQDYKIHGGVIFEPRKGKGNAIRRAFHDIDADVYIMADADQTYPASRANNLIDRILDGTADMVVGDRQSEGHYGRENKRPFHNQGNRLVQKMVNLLFDASLVDIMSGYRVFNRSFVKSYPILVEGFEIETDMTLHALDKRFRIIEIPIEYKDRPEGSQSKLSTIKDGARVILTIVSILRYYRPFLFFGSMSLLVAALGVVTAIPVLQDWIKFHYIYHIPLAILSTGMEIVSILLFAIGLILDGIGNQDKRNFERELMRFNDK